MTIRGHCRQFLFIAFCLLTLTACTDEPRTSIAMGLNTAPVTLDPRYATDAISYRLTRLLYRSLVDFDEQFQTVPDLASWEQLASDHYRFYLQQAGRDFHHGKRLAAEDVKATYESVLNPENISPHRGSVSMIERIEIIDGNTLDFHLNRNDPLFAGRLVIGILPADLISKQHPFKQQPVGSGAFQLLGWPDESRLLLTRVEDEQVVELLTVKDPTVRVLKLLRGEIDLIQGNLSPEVVRWLEQQPDIEVRKQRGDTFTYLGFNLEDELTGQLPVRRAIGHAINRPAIIRYVLDETARPAAALLSPMHWAGHDGLAGLDYKPELARQLLAQQGYSEQQPLRLTYKTSSNPLRLRLATIIQSQLQAVGIEVEIQSYDWGTFYADIKSGRFQMYSLSWVGLKMPDIFRYVFHSASLPPAGANRGRLQDERVDQLIEQAEQQQAPEQQARYYRELQAYLLEVLPYVPLWYEDNVLAISDSISGYTLSTDGNFDSLMKVQRQPHE